ncbi:hypothetical protein SODALDRAFT_362891 [Sodiomyces alkalinus F11]|uniref:WW domain-containing protein n=1 Tax=Sodiomyces alkalinus (strain CBS 110278 / VKM F-3762 / F11) TaxID=1314773 RepID=A0A3N2PNC3_SODAK|nr:hypothetical protein SODALDRAFT_362891 [Sodiomyces alkalinus F11]ROT36031.1 hypothetical protein SODALDRAFT_362891 [Sodiomyces alkalinus F11]
MASHPPSPPREAQVADSKPNDTKSEDHRTPEPESSTSSLQNEDQEKRDSSRDRTDSHEPPESLESGEASPSSPRSRSENTPAEDDDDDDDAAAARTSSDAPAPPLPNEPPPLPSEQPPATEDDGWDFHWDAHHQAYFFYNRFTGASQWENPRVPSSSSKTTTTTTTATGAQPPPQPAAPSDPSPSSFSVAAASSSSYPTAPPPPPSTSPVAGGYNPAIHGDYDPNAWYAQPAGQDGDEAAQQQQQQLAMLADPTALATFNRFTGVFQRQDEGPERHSDEAKSRRQMHAYFDVDAAANAHDGRSLKAERSGKKPSKAELKQFKEKRRARKEEKRRAWLRD